MDTDATVLLREAASLFREYERQHRAKIPVTTDTIEKAERNAAFASRIEAFLSAPRPPETDFRVQIGIAAGAMMNYCYDVMEQRGDAKPSIYDRLSENNWLELAATALGYQGDTALGDCFAVAHAACRQPRS